MAKKRSKYTRHRKQKRYTRRTMKGGTFSQQEMQQLQSNGFSQYQIESLTNLGISFNEVMQKINAITNQEPNGFSGNSDDLADQVMSELLNINTNANSQQFDAASQGPMDMDELNTSSLSNFSGYTTEEDIGGSNRKRISKKILAWL